MRFNTTFYFLAICLLFLNFEGKSQVFDIIVDMNGSGDFTTLQAAINSVPDNSGEKTLVFVKQGVYKEKIVLSSTKTNLSIIGEDPETVIFSWDDYQGRNGISGADSYTLLAESPGLYMENITIENTAGKVGQAVAIRTTGDTMAFKNCRFIGFQDTYYAHKRRQYNHKCYVEGGTDFIYGDATAVFDSCTINCVKGGQYITAPADSKFVTQLSTGKFIHGLLFRNSEITADNDVEANSYYLGRPWQPDASSVYYDCILGPHIKPEGWSTWGNDNHESSVFAEHESRNPDGSLVDISQRVPWSYQLNNELDTLLYALNFFLRKDWVVWDVDKVVKALPAPKNVVFNENVLTWDPVESAIGYLVLANDSVIEISSSTSYNISAEMQANTVFDVKSVSSNGNLSIKSSEIPTAVYKLNSINEEIKIELFKNQLKFSEDVNYEVFTISGKRLISGNGNNISLSNTLKGIYIIKAVNSQGNYKTQKIHL